MSNILGKRSNRFVEGVFTDVIQDYDGNGTIDVTGDLAVTGSATATGDITVTGDLTAGGDLDVTGDAVIDGTTTTPRITSSSNSGLFIGSGNIAVSGSELQLYRGTILGFEQAEYTTATDINYNGTTQVDTSIAITLSPGTYLMGYAACINIDSVRTDVFVADSSNTPIDKSRTEFITASGTATVEACKVFAYTVASEETYHLAFVKASGASTSAAITMSGAHSMWSDPEQVVQLWAFSVSAGNIIEASDTSATTINAPTSGYTDVLTCTGATVGNHYLVFPGFAIHTNGASLRRVSLRQSDDTVVAEVGHSRLASGSQNVSACAVAPYYLASAADTEYKLSIDMYNNSGLDNTPFIYEDSQVPTMTMLSIGTTASLASAESILTGTYSGTVDLNGYPNWDFTGGNSVTLTGLQVALTPGWWLVSYGFPFKDYVTDSAIFLTTGVDTVVAGSKMFVSRSAGIGMRTHTKTFLLYVATETTYQVKAKIDSASTIDGGNSGFGPVSVFAYRVIGEPVLSTSAPMRFARSAIRPGGARTGTVYYDTADNKLKVFTGSDWETITSS